MFLQRCAGSELFRRHGVNAEVDELWEELFGVQELRARELWNQAMAVANALAAADDDPDRQPYAADGGHGNGWA